MSGVRAAKAAKSIIFSSQSTDAHTQSKIKSVIKWLKSGHEVRVQITGKQGKSQAMENIYTRIEEDVKSGARLLQKAVRPDLIKFYLMPTEGSVSLKLKNPTQETVGVDDEIADLLGDQDIFSESFESKLLDSIKQEKKNRKKS